jgi:hypothetical protein
LRLGESGLDDVESPADAAILSCCRPSQGTGWSGATLLPDVRANLDIVEN